jgi:hypothetical protein
MKQETLKELSLQKYPFSNSERNAFITGYNQAKEEQQNMYSEEEVIRIARDAYAMGRNIVLIGTFNKWFKQFKKK